MSIKSLLFEQTVVQRWDFLPGLVATYALTSGVCCPKQDLFSLRAYIEFSATGETACSPSWRFSKRPSQLVHKCCALLHSTAGMLGCQSIQNCGSYGA